MSDKKKLQILNSKLTQMTATPKKRRRRKSPAMAAPRRRRVTHHKPATRRRRRLNDGGTGNIKGMVTMGLKAAAGGAIHEAPRFLKEPLSDMMQGAWDVGGAYAIAKIGKSPTAAAGFVGAAASRWMDKLFHKSMHDGYDLSAYEYVDPDTLSDSGFDDDFGDPVMMDDDGNMYALNEMGDGYDLAGHIDDYDDGMHDNGMDDDMEDLALINLQDSPYELQAGY